MPSLEVTGKIIVGKDGYWDLVIDEGSPMFPDTVSEVIAHIAHELDTMPHLYNFVLKLEVK